MGRNKSIEVSVIVLCYKASNLIKTFLDDIIFEADKRSLKYEIILVDDIDRDFWFKDFIKKNSYEYVILGNLGLVFIK